MYRIVRLSAPILLCAGFAAATAPTNEPAPISEASFKCIRAMTPVTIHPRQKTDPRCGPPLLLA